MKYNIKKIFLAVICVLFVIGSLIFYFGGKWIRDALSPAVTWVYPEYVLAEDGGITGVCLPASTVRYEDGDAYVFEVRTSDQYIEQCYEVSLHSVIIEFEKDGMVYLNLGNITGDKRIVTDPHNVLKDGMRVRVE